MRQPTTPEDAAEHTHSAAVGSQGETQQNRECRGMLVRCEGDDGLGHIGRLREDRVL